MRAATVGSRMDAGPLRPGRGRSVVVSLVQHLRAGMGLLGIRGAAWLLLCQCQVDDDGGC
jgi:hypothetical protein